MGMSADIRQTARTGLVADPVYKAHDTRSFHPESPARIDAVLRGIGESVDQARLQSIPLRAATRDELHLCHPPHYVDLVSEEVAAGRRQLSTGDTDIGEQSYDVALKAVGGVIMAADAVCRREVRNAFCAVRPPGHHARADQGMGFCIFNSVAVAARFVQREHGIARVAIIDWDVHHGNGTQDIFYEDASVFYFSTHQSPLYPGTGAKGETGRGDGVGTTLNCPVPAGTDGVEILGLFESQLIPALDAFKPEFIFISAGFDARKEEPISQLLLEDEDFGDLTRIVLNLADQHARGRLVSSLEGGYGLAGLASSCGEHVKGLTCE
jgi:acetoin utilization deacetylase AcuC-like enzyme